MSIEDKIKEAVKFHKDNNIDCSFEVCPNQSFCDETRDYTSMNFCNYTAEQIIKELDR